MVTIASNTGTEEDIREVMVNNGLQPQEPVKAEEPKEPVEEKVAPKSAEAPGEKVPAETEDKTAAELETAGDKSQEKPPQGQEPVVEGQEPKKSKGGFQAKNEKLARQLNEARENLELERGDKTKLQARVDELAAEVAKLKPAEPDKPKELVRPKRPSMKDLEYDQDKYDEALGKYEEELDAYHAAMTDKKVSDSLNAVEEKRKKDDQDARTAKALGEFEERRKAGESAYEDYGDLVEALPKDATTLVDRSRVIADYIQFKSKNPAHLIHFLMKDFVEGDEAEAGRLEKMDDFDQLIAIKEIEDRLIREHKAESKVDKEVTTEEKPKAKAAEVVPPVEEKPKKVKTPDAPITPVGSSAAAKGKNLDEQMAAAAAANNGKEFRRLLALQEKEHQAARV